MKKTVCLLLALVMVLSMIPFGVLAADETSAEGTEENPATLQIGENTAACSAEGDYYYTWTAPENGTLTITMPDSEKTPWAYGINDGTEHYYDGDTDEDGEPIVDTEGNAVIVPSESVYVLKDEVVILYVRYCDDGYDPAEGKVVFTAEFKPDPIAVRDADGVDTNGINAEVTVEAGKTRYYSVRGEDLSLTVSGNGVFVVTYGETTVESENGTATVTGITAASTNEPAVFAIKNGTDEDVTYQITVLAPAGSQANPVKLDLGSNTASLAADNDVGYYYTWTAEADGTLSARITDITSKTTGATGDIRMTIQSENGSTQYSLSEATEAGEEALNVPVAEGDTVMIVVSAVPVNNVYPAADITFSTEFTASTDSGGDESGDDEPVVVGSVLVSETEALTADKKIEYTWTATADGILTVSITDKVSPGWASYVVFEDGSTSLFKSGTAKKSYNQEVLEGKTYIVTIYGYNTNTSFPAAATIPYEISFEPTVIEVKKDPYIISSTELTEAGTYTIKMENSDVTVVPLTPTQTGYYTISVTGDAQIGNYGGNTNYIYDSSAVEHSASFEWVCQVIAHEETVKVLNEAGTAYETVTQTVPGQSLMIGIISESDTVQVTVERTGDYVEEVTEDRTYENKATLSPFTVPENMELGDYVDIFSAHTAVLGEDGYYHLDSADGDILLIDMDYMGIVLTAALETTTGRDIMYATVTDGEGNKIRYDIGAAVQAYEAVMDENGYYPLTEDLIFFYQVYAINMGAISGVLMNTTYGDTTAWEACDRDTAWMYCCITMSEKAAEPSVEYSYGQSAQIRLIEPWGLKLNARVYTDKTPTGGSIDYSSVYSYGAYMIRGSELDKQGLTEDTITLEDILSDADAIHYTKDNGVEVDGNNLSVIYDKELYTYEFDDSVFVVFYVVTNEGEAPYYLQIRERNLLNLVTERKDSTSTTYTQLEKTVYGCMYDLYYDITSYRADFTEISDIERQNAPTLAEYALGAAVENSPYTFAPSVQISLIEPWGMKVNARVYTDTTPTGGSIDYSTLEEYGAVVLFDEEASYARSDVAALIAREDAYVFSSKNGDAFIDDNKISAIYNKDLFTYQLDSKAYVVLYIKDATGYHYGEVRERNLYDLMCERMDSTSGTYTEKEKAVYKDMVNLYTAVTAYRDDYFTRNPQ